MTELNIKSAFEFLRDQADREIPWQMQYTFKNSDHLARTSSYRNVVVSKIIKMPRIWRLQLPEPEQDDVHINLSVECRHGQWTAESLIIEPATADPSCDLVFRCFDQDFPAIKRTVYTLHGEQYRFSDFQQSPPRHQASDGFPNKGFKQWRLQSGRVSVIIFVY